MSVSPGFRQPGSHHDGAFGVDPLALFEMYAKVTGVPTLAPSTLGDPRLRGMKLGIVNSGTWTSLWSNYFGKQIIPEVKFVNVGNEAVQLSFMEAHHRGLPCPPESNIQAFVDYAKDLVELVGVDAVLISCSTMNRSFPRVEEALRPYDVPVVQIDIPLMERAVSIGNRVLVVATHGPTVENTRLLLEETAAKAGKPVTVFGTTVEAAFDYLGGGAIVQHNDVIANAIREEMQKHDVDVVVLAQLSMTVFKLSYPDDIGSFGVPVLTSGEEGFKRVREVLEIKVSR